MKSIAISGRQNPLSSFLCLKIDVMKMDISLSIETCEYSHLVKILKGTCKAGLLFHTKDRRLTMCLTKPHSVANRESGGFQ